MRMNRPHCIEVRGILSENDLTWVCPNGHKHSAKIWSARDIARRRTLHCPECGKAYSVVAD